MAYVFWEGRGKPKTLNPKDEPPSNKQETLSFTLHPKL